MKAYSELKRKVQERMSADANLSDAEVKRVIYQTLADEQKTEFMDVRERAKIGKKLFDALRGLDVLQELAEDDDVTDIMVNGVDRIFYEKNGRMYRFPESFESEERLREVIMHIVGSVNRTVNERSPIVDARLADGSRVNAVFPPIALQGPTLTIRRFSQEPITIADWISQGGMTAECAAFLEQAVRERFNIFVCGGTSSGKTTLLNILSEFIPEEERIITIEDTAELKLSSRENLVSLEARPAGEEGAPPVSIRDLIKASLRMRPDRIIVGEIRGEEAIDMLQAMNSGHEGSLSTGHANSCTDMLSRIETMVLMGNELPLQAVRSQIASAIDLLVFLNKDRDGGRRISEIVQLTMGAMGEYQYEPLFLRNEEGLFRTENTLWRKRKTY